MFTERWKCYTNMTQSRRNTNVVRLALNVGYGNWNCVLSVLSSRNIPQKYPKVIRAACGESRECLRCSDLRAGSNCVPSWFQVACKSSASLVQSRDIRAVTQMCYDTWDSAMLPKLPAIWSQSTPDGQGGWFLCGRTKECAAHITGRLRPVRRNADSAIKCGFRISPRRTKNVRRTMEMLHEHPY